ncbi:hypothetical protein, partial [Propionivibrio sp.]|uniref:hypothetical protein n=1 Tax=Propionivibrio sp. TaxID=2212460 RepID=UPI003BEFAFA0
RPEGWQRQPEEVLLGCAPSGGSSTSMYAGRSACAKKRFCAPYKADVFIAVAVVPVRCKRDLLAGAEKLFDLLNRAQPCFVHVDHHPCDDQPTYQFRLKIIASGSLLDGNTALVQAHTSLDIAAARICVACKLHYNHD